MEFMEFKNKNHKKYLKDDQDVCICRSQWARNVENPCDEGKKKWIR